MNLITHIFSLDTLSYNVLAERDVGQNVLVRNLKSPESLVDIKMFIDNIF